MGVTVASRPVGRPAKYEGPFVDWQIDIANYVISWLQKNGRVASGESSNFVITTVKKPTVVSLNGAPYLGFALSGRGPGEPPPIFRILEWVNIKPRYNGLDPQTLNSLAWAIRDNIGRRGWSPKTKTIRPQELGKVIRKLGVPHLQEMSRGLAELMAQDIFESFSRGKNYELLKTLRR